MNFDRASILTVIAVLLFVVLGKCSGPTDMNGARIERTAVRP